jgi:hypothetical protein
VDKGIGEGENDASMHGSAGEPLPVPNMASRSDLLAPGLGRHSRNIGKVQANIRLLRAPHNEFRARPMP